jgi:hypothetical protein
MSSFKRCQCITKTTHLQCSRNASEGDFCHQHQKCTDRITGSPSVTDVSVSHLLELPNNELSLICQTMIDQGQFSTLVSLTHVNKRLYNLCRPLLVAYYLSIPPADPYDTEINRGGYKHKIERIKYMDKHTNRYVVWNDLPSALTFDTVLMVEDKLDERNEQNEQYVIIMRNLLNSINYVYDKYTQTKNPSIIHNSSKEIKTLYRAADFYGRDELKKAIRDILKSLKNKKELLQLEPNFLKVGTD